MLISSEIISSKVEIVIELDGILQKIQNKKDEFNKASEFSESKR